MNGEGDCAATLSNEEISRYSRQLILPEVGITGQKKLLCSSVLIVGAGGLGCPCALYLASAGIGRLGLVDSDVVDLSNLHRQILHQQSSIGTTKPSSAKHALNSLNSHVEVVTHELLLSSSNALDIISSYDVIVDATDNVSTRYLLNDSCVLLHKPLVSGSALRFEGQLTVYNYAGGPCYRCLFPKPPPPETVTNCSDGGVLGVVPGIIGSLQALEVLKLCMCVGDVSSGSLMLFDGLCGRFRHIKLRSRSAECVVCGDQPTITQLIDYTQFCGSAHHDKDTALDVLPDADRVTAVQYKELQSSPHLLLDIRTPTEVNICSLPNHVNIPANELTKPERLEQIKSQVNNGDQPSLPVYVVCRAGNDSQMAVQLLQKSLPQLCINDIKGGLLSWATTVDHNFPQY